MCLADNVRVVRAQLLRRPGDKYKCPRWTDDDRQGKRRKSNGTQGFFLIRVLKFHGMLARFGSGCMEADNHRILRIEVTGTRAMRFGAGNSA